LPDGRRGWNTGVRRNDVSRILAKLGYQSYVIIAYLNYLYFIYFRCFHSCDTEIIVCQPWWRVFVWLLGCGVRYGVCCGGCWPCRVGVAWRYHLMRATRRFRVVSLGEWRVNHRSHVGRRLELCTLPVKSRLVLGYMTCWGGSEPGDGDVRGMSCRLGEQWDE